MSFIKMNIEFNQFTDENEGEFRYLARANNTSEWMGKFYMKYVAVILCGAAAISLLSVAYGCLSQGNFNADHFYRPARFVYAIEIRLR